MGDPSVSHAILFADGASRGNPGPAAYGFVILSPSGEELDRGKATLGKVTNNVAEYQGVLNGLKRCLELGIPDVRVHSDSQLLVRQLEGRYKVRAPGILPLFQQIKAVCNDFKKVTFTHVPREENTVADSLANEALDASH